MLLAMISNSTPIRFAKFLERRGLQPQVDGDESDLLRQNLPLRS